MSDTLRNIGQAIFGAADQLAGQGVFGETGRRISNEVRGAASKLPPPPPPPINPLPERQDEPGGFFSRLFGPVQVEHKGLITVALIAAAGLVVYLLARKS